MNIASASERLASRRNDVKPGVLPYDAGLNVLPKDAYARTYPLLLQ